MHRLMHMYMGVDAGFGTDIDIGIGNYRLKVIDARTDMYRYVNIRNLLLLL